MPSRVPIILTEYLLDKFSKMLISMNKVMTTA